MLKVWNVGLVLATGILAILGTFLVRSGILDSIHAFGASTLGIPFVVLIVGLIALSIALVAWRSTLLKSENRIDSMLSREAAFLFNNLLFVGLAFVVFFGTFYPLITEALGDRRNVGPPWFNRVTVPLAIGLIGLAAVAPLISWRRVTRANLRRNVALPAAFGALVTVALVAAGGVAGKPLALIMFGLAAMLVAGVAQEFWRGTRARRAMSSEAPPLAVLSLVRRNRRRYGGYLVHVGMATMFVGVAASSAFQTAHDVRMKPGDQTTINGYQVKYVKPIGRVETRDGRVERITLGSRLEVSKDGEVLRTLEPTKGYYPASAPFAPVSGMFEGESTSEVRMIAGLRRDVWTAVSPELAPLRPEMRTFDRAIRKMAEDGQSVDRQVLAFRVGLEKVVRSYAAGQPASTFRLIVSPLVAWIWIGGTIVFGGGLISMWPAPDAARRRATAGYAARVAQDLGRA